ncbi:unnamed protein product [Schistosoma mattheei]|uniref:Uncharacterized protein n=1 Tax=Schistosoma mattheei TaxID=31246 RepID=A0A183P030_9TREM|nr:unnamed protein product [Schistosoma mattheei]
MISQRKSEISMYLLYVKVVVRGNQKETVDLDFVLLITRQQSVLVILIEISPEMFNLFESNLFKKNLPYYTTGSYLKNIQKQRVELIPIKSSPEHGK